MVRVEGTFIDGNGIPVPYVNIRLEAESNTVTLTGEVLKRVSFEYQTDINGVYSFDVVQGKYRVFSNINNVTQHLGSLVITSESPATNDLTTLLNIETEVYSLAESKYLQILDTDSNVTIIHNDIINRQSAITAMQTTVTTAHDDVVTRHDDIIARNTAIETLNTNVNTQAANVNTQNTNVNDKYDATVLLTGRAEDAAVSSEEFYQGVLLLEPQLNTHATNANQSAIDAAGSASAADTTLTAVNVSAASAATDAATATTQATTATTQADIATTKASEASTDAASASTSAATATTGANTATTKASEASTSATNAATSATNASTSESNAAISATAAIDALNTINNIVEW